LQKHRKMHYHGCVHEPTTAMMTKSSPLLRPPVKITINQQW
jgi:hypothetical protein